MPKVDSTQGPERGSGTSDAQAPAAPKESLLPAEEPRDPGRAPPPKEPISALKTPFAATCGVVTTLSPGIFGWEGPTYKALV